MIPARIYPVVVPANGMAELPVVGTYFKVLSATNTFIVRGDTFGEMGAIQPGQGLRGVAFNKLQFVDTSGGANTLQVLVAAAEFVDQTTVGAVSVVDGGKSRTMAGQAFCLAGNVGAVAGQDAITGLWNPVGSGVNAIIKQVSGMPIGTTGTIFFGSSKTRLFAGAGHANSKLTTATGSLTSAGFQDSGNMLSPTLDAVYLAPSPGANQFFTWAFTEPVVIAPGSGFYIDCRTANVGLNGVIEFYEEKLA